MLTTNQGLILPDGTDNANVPLTFTDFVTTAGSGMENRLVQRYVSIADRTARNAAPNEGEFSYLSDLNRYDTYTGSAWIPLLIPVNFAADSNTYGGITSLVFTTAGAPILGATIPVPQSGQVRVDWMGLLDNSTATGSTYIAPQLNAGSVIGAGAVISAASNANTIRSEGTSAITSMGFNVYSGLTPGTDVNAFLNHRVDTITGTIALRKISLSQA